MTTHRPSPLVLAATAFSMSLHLTVALLVQEDLIAGQPWLQAYTALCREAVPGVERLARLSAFPELTRLVVSLMWTLAPAFAALCLWQAGTPAQFVMRWRERPIFLTLLLIVPLAVLAFAFRLADFAAGDLLLRTLSTSRLALGLMAGVLTPAIALSLYVILLWLANARAIYSGATPPHEQGLAAK